MIGICTPLFRVTVGTGTLIVTGVSLSSWCAPSTHHDGSGAGDAVDGGTAGTCQPHRPHTTVTGVDARAEIQAPLEFHLTRPDGAVGSRLDYAARDRASHPQFI